MKKLLLLFLTVSSLSISANAQSPEESYKKGLNYSEAGNYGVAIRFFTDGAESSLKDTGQNFPVIFFKNLAGRAIAKFNIEDYSGAISDWDMVLKYMSTGNVTGDILELSKLKWLKAYAILNRGGVHRFIGEHQKACSELRRAADMGFPDIKELAYQEMEFEGCSL